MSASTVLPSDQDLDFCSLFLTGNERTFLKILSSDRAEIAPHMTPRWSKEEQRKSDCLVIPLFQKYTTFWVLLADYLRVGTVK